MMAAGHDTSRRTAYGERAALHGTLWLHGDRTMWQGVYRAGQELQDRSGASGGAYGRSMSGKRIRSGGISRNTMARDSASDRAGRSCGDSGAVTGQAG